jgi:hypothetical protein
MAPASWSAASSWSPKDSSTPPLPRVIGASKAPGEVGIDATRLGIHVGRQTVVTSCTSLGPISDILATLLGGREFAYRRPRIASAYCHLPQRSSSAVANAIVPAIPDAAARDIRRITRTPSGGVRCSPALAGRCPSRAIWAGATASSHLGRREERDDPRRAARIAWPSH